MYTSSSDRSSYTLPRTSSYVSSRYSNVTSALPPVSSRYTSSRYSSSLGTTYRSSYSRPSTYLTTSRYSTSSALSSPVQSTQSWRSTVSASPLLTRKSSISSGTTDYASRRPSISSGTIGRSDSITSLSTSDTYTRRSSYVSSPAIKEEWTPRTSRLNSLSSNASLAPTTSSYGTNYRLGSLSGESSKLAAGRIGLNNLGNTCFMNAVLQCLCHTSPLVEYCKRGSFNNDVNHRSPTGGDLIKAFASLINVIWSNNSNNAVSPDHVKRELQKYAPRFAGFNQQDAQELLRYLLQGLHDDINRVTNKHRPVTNEHTSLTQSAFDSWRRYRNIDDSKIVDIFAGQLKSTLKCVSCGNVSTSFDPFWDLSLPIPDGGRVTLQQCFRLFTSPETLDGSERPFCERCKAKKCSTKQFEINRFPTILVIHLKRFSSGFHYTNKLNVNVDCPERNLDLSQFASSDCINSNASYNLYGVVDHFGGSSSGHYTAKCKDIETSQWSEFNDSMVSTAKSSDLVNDKAYLLFYEQSGRRYSRL